MPSKCGCSKLKVLFDPHLLERLAIQSVLAGFERYFHLRGMILEDCEQICDSPACLVLMHRAPHRLDTSAGVEQVAVAQHLQDASKNAATMSADYAASVGKAVAKGLGIVSALKSADATRSGKSFSSVLHGWN